ncbi:pectate lyase [Anopheles sinensis]|uniref:Pectate lyase n=1 Tax=Anopheles sinensis TaxID=74873 RepID=A0A084WM34_ANOSI|nr:pectate lyase [Anopheles sinensis]
MANPIKQQQALLLILIQPIDASIGVVLPFADIVETRIVHRTTATFLGQHHTTHTSHQPNADDGKHERIIGS